MKKMKKVTITKSENYEDDLQKWVNWANNFLEPEKKPKGNRSRKSYIKKFACADFETTNDDTTRNSFVYSWAFCFNGHVIIGRTLESFMRFLYLLSKEVGNNCMVIYFHNLSFDITFIQGVWHFGLDDCFCMDNRKILKANMGTQFELRCSYLLTNMSLALFTKEMKVKHRKLSGQKFDYNIYRTPKKALKRYEINYIINDVLGMEEALYKFFSIEQDNLYTICYTSTGFVRRDLKRAIEKLPFSRRKEWQLDMESYKACREAMRGGNTHGSRFYSDTIMENVHSFDFASCYPCALVFSDRYPKRNFKRLGKISISDFEYYRKNMAMILRVRVWGCRLHDIFEPFPYISFSKIRHEINTTLDNGRVLTSKFFEFTCTDLDMLTILEQYDFDKLEIYDSFACACGRLPEEIRQLVIKWFKMKCELKNVSGQELLYANIKAKLNAIFGCTCMESCKRLLLYDEEKQEFRFDESQTDEELLERYNKKGFLPYSIGIFTTAICRRMLEEVKNMIPKTNTLYCDTDSAKFVGDIHIFDEYNKKQIELCEKEGVYGFNKKGKKCYLGTFEYEETYKYFKEMGAKKYCYIDMNDNLHLTCAGVHKTKGAYELQQNGGINAFTDGFVFKYAGGTTSVYNDLADFDIIRNGEKIHITKNIYICDSEYTLGRTADYMQICEIAIGILSGNIDNCFDVGYTEKEINK